MAKTRNVRVFDTDRRIRLGIWGLGRGMSFYRTCEALNLDVVAGCDYNAHMREGFLKANPGAFATADADEFLAQGFDAVLLATFCPAHADDAIRCLAAGKHVLSEVTAFHTLAEGVRLVEAVERSGKVYNLAENYPWTPTNMWLARKWKEGLFGDLMYAEYEYVHECRSLAYTYIDGKPVQPGHHVHSWRSWINYHYYNTHSLGPVMIITGTRPVKVTALPSSKVLAGYPGSAGAVGRQMGGATPSLVLMNNGGLVRNLMGATTNDSHIQRLWGTKGAAQMAGNGLELRLGGAGHSPMHQVRPTLDALGELAAKTGHGGGDFWVLYYFARQLLEGTPSPWDLYPACDVTIPGIQAYRSALQDGEPQPCPDFRDPKVRAAYRDDDWRQEHLDPQEWAFPKAKRDDLTAVFSTTMTNLIQHALAVRAVIDWATVLDDTVVDEKLVKSMDAVIDGFAAIKAAYAQARRTIDAHPKANAARVLREMLEDIGAESRVLTPGFLPWVKRQRARLARQLRLVPRQRICDYQATTLQPKPHTMRVAKLPGKELTFRPAPYRPTEGYTDIREFHGGGNGLLYVRGRITLKHGGEGGLLYGADGPVKVWINGRLAACEPDATTPLFPLRYRTTATWRQGRNEVLFALDSNKAEAWGVGAEVELAPPAGAKPKGARQRATPARRA